MENELFKEIALFRFSLIAPLVNGTYEGLSKMQYFREIGSKKHLTPTGKLTNISPYTIKRWYINYTNKGIDGLIPKRREDSGRPRVLDDNTVAKIHDYKERYPYITAKMIYHKLIEDGYIKSHKASLASVQRYIRDNKLKKRNLVPTDRKAFEMEYANDCWQADTSHGPKIIIDNKKVQTYLISVMDDASRLIVGSEFFLNDNALNMQKVFKSSILRHGLPKKLYVDNGKPYKNNQINMICASLGVQLINSKPYSPQGKGKQERFFRTIKDGYINATDWNDFKSLEHLNEQFQQYLRKYYIHKEHSIIKMTPKNRFLKDINNIKYLCQEELEKIFLHRVNRTVNNDATITINKKLYEAPPKYIKERIEIRYNPTNMEEVYIFSEGVLCDTIYPLNRVENSKVKRNIDYSTLGADKDV